jgi:hypothetical protein
VIAQLINTYIDRYIHTLLICCKYKRKNQSIWLGRAS